VVAKVRERLAVNKQRSPRLHMERLKLKKLNEVEGKDKYYVEVSNKCTVWMQWWKLIVFGKRYEILSNFQPKGV
jgi:hypothetical protein